MDHEEIYPETAKDVIDGYLVILITYILLPLLPFVKVDMLNVATHFLFGFVLFTTFPFLALVDIILVKIGKKTILSTFHVFEIKADQELT